MPAIESNDPYVVNPTEANYTDRLIRLPSNGSLSIQDVPPPQIIIPTAKQELTPDYDWYFLAPIYSLIQLDKDAVELYAVFMNRSFKTKTVEAAKPVFNVDKADIKANPWFYLLHGIPFEHSLGFRDYIESFIFRTPTKQWRVTWKQQLINDVGISPTPFKTWISLTHNITTSRRLDVSGDQTLGFVNEI